MISFLRITLALFIVLLSTSLLAGSDHGIHWQQSSMPQALALAKQQNKPLFVYWGAVWCPPCNVVKTTIFRDPDFIQATRDYINVYLDGDTQQAQQWGETLKAKGYPTLMILSPLGKEIMRLSTSQSGAQLAQTLNYTRNVWNPISRLLAAALREPDIDPKKIQAILSYSWDQDDTVAHQAADYADKLLTLQGKLTDKDDVIERSQLFLQALSLKIDSLKNQQTLDNTQQQHFRNRLSAILSSPVLSRANLLTLAYMAQNLVSHLTSQAKDSPDDNRTVLIAQFEQTMRKLRQSPQLNHEQFFATFNPSVDFHDTFNTPLKDDDKRQLIAYTIRAVKNTRDKKERAAMMSDATYLLFHFGMKQQAKQITLAALKQSIAPYYLMSMMGYFESQQGHDEQALQWYEKAYLSAKGPATRLQWYGKYVRKLIELKPAERANIKTNVAKLLTDYSRMTDAFFGRNYRVLLAVRKAARKWARKQHEEDWFASLRQQGQRQCNTATSEVYKSGCYKFYQGFKPQSA